MSQPFHTEASQAHGKTRRKRSYSFDDRDGIREVPQFLRNKSSEPCTAMFHSNDRVKKPPQSRTHQRQSGHFCVVLMVRLLRIAAIFMVSFLGFLLVVGPLWKVRNETMPRAENLFGPSLALHDDYTLSSHPTDLQFNPDNMNSTEYFHYCHELSDVSIWNLGSRINCRNNSETLSMAFVVCILFTLSIELVLHYIEHKFSKDELKKEILSKVYREVAMLSIISSLIGAFESINLFELLFDAVDAVEEWIENLLHITIHEHAENKEERTERRVKLFEFVHVSLFMLSCWFVGIVSICYRILRRRWRRWKVYEKHWTAKQSLEEYNSLKKEIASKKKTIIFRWTLLTKFYGSLLKSTYFTVRQRFIMKNRISEPFRFYRYLKDCAITTFSSLIEVSLFLWTIVWIGFLFNYLRNKIWDMRTSYGGAPLFVFLFGYGSVVVSAIVLLWLFIGLNFYARHNNLDTLIENSNEENTYDIPGGSEQNNKTSESNKYGTLLSIQASSNNTYYDLENGDAGTNKKTMRRYLFLGSQNLSFYVIQFILLVQAFYITFIIIHFAFVIFREDYFGTFGARLVFYITALLPTLLFVTFFFPQIVPLYVILTSIENLSKEGVIETSQEDRHAHTDTA